MSALARLEAALKGMAGVATIAIDGPVASGKTAVGRSLARALGFRFVDTGLLYRAVAWAALQRGVAPGDPEALAGLSREVRIEVVDTQGGERVLVDGEDATGSLRDPAVEGTVSTVSRVAGVREALVAVQRGAARDGRVVMVGRDIGTAILPNADLKVFLAASVDERARRRHLDLVAAGSDAPLSRVRDELEARDRIDSQREHSPLRPAQDACLVDTDGVSLEGVVERILALVKAG